MRHIHLALAICLLVAVPAKGLCQPYIKWADGYPKAGGSGKILVKGTIILGPTNKLTSTKLKVECWRKLAPPLDKNGTYIEPTSIDIVNNAFGESAVSAPFSGKNYWVAATAVIDKLDFRTPGNVWSVSGK